MTTTEGGHSSHGTAGSETTGHKRSIFGESDNKISVAGESVPWVEVKSTDTAGDGWGEHSKSFKKWTRSAPSLCSSHLLSIFSPDVESAPTP